MNLDFNDKEFNSKQTIGWTEINYRVDSTLPKANEKVLACDMYGNMAVCYYDNITLDFMLSIDGFNVDHLKSNLLAIVDRVIEDKLNIEIDEEMLEQVHDINNQETYFDAVAAWMPLPPIHPSIAFCDELQGIDFEIKTYDVLDAIAPAVRRAIAEALAIK